MGVSVVPPLPDSEIEIMPVPFSKSEVHMLKFLAIETGLPVERFVHDRALGFSQTAESKNRLNVLDGYRDLLAQKEAVLREFGLKIPGPPEPSPRLQPVE